MTAQTMNTTDSISCILCGSPEHTIIHSLKAEEILKCWALYGPPFTGDVAQFLLNESVIHLYECSQCGFNFFNPSLAGSGEFYQQLHARGPGYYATDRPEYQRNARFAVEHGFHKILDVGCGTGIALDVAKRMGLETFGMELSATAAEEAARRGHTIFPVLLDEMESSWEGKFDLISLNQVLEHVPDPPGLIRQCARLLSPRGAIAIAVPAVTGLLRFCPWLESNWPPHHLSRWKQRDFQTLAMRSGLRVVETGGDRLLGAAIQDILLGHRERCCALDKPYHGLPPMGIKVVSQIYRKTGLKWLFSSQGQSVYCYLSR
jgi:SAM-dependent methyltransferase